MDRYGKHIEKALTLTHYETPMTPIGYLIMDNQVYAKKVVYQYYRSGHHN